jgi:hypothetical protein
MPCREFQFNRQRTLKEMLEVSTLEEILDAAISWRRNSETQDRLPELVGKLFYRLQPVCITYLDT